MSQDNFSNVNMDPSERNCISLPVGTITYRWVIIFNWNGDCPFKAYERAMFKEIKEEWIKGQLKPKSRAKKLMLSSLPAQTVSLFGKIETSKKTMNA